MSAITDMNRVFYDARHFNQNLSAWDVSSVTNMSGMFYRATSFNQDLSTWDVSRVTDMSFMFLMAHSFSQILCSVAWITSKATKVKMFDGSQGSICTTTTGKTNAPAAVLAMVFAGAVVVLVLLVLLVGLVALVVALVTRRRSKMPTNDMSPVEVPLISNESLISPNPDPNLDPLLAPPMDEAMTNINTTTLPVETRTFANSNYKRLYAEANPAPFQHDLLDAVNNVLKLYTARIHPRLAQTTLEKGVHEFMEKIQDDAFRDSKALRDDVGAVAEYLWTSAKSHPVSKGLELCSVLNAVVRDDIAQEIQAAAVIFRSINSRRVRRINEDPNTGSLLEVQSYPPKGETWRGGSFRRQHRAFFASMIGRKYRVPGFLATTVKRTVASTFAFKANKDYPCALWRITFDPRGKHDYEYRVQHMTFVSKTLIKGEHEYLFAAYSVFKLVSIEWSAKLSKPHKFVIRAAVNNKSEDENLPLAPWY